MYICMYIQSLHCRCMIPVWIKNWMVNFALFLCAPTFVYTYISEACSNCGSHTVKKVVDFKAPEASIFVSTRVPKILDSQNAAQ